MGKKAFIKSLVLVLLLVRIQTGNIVKANPLLENTPSQNISWVHLTTVTGNLSQTVALFMPNLSHWFVTGIYVTSAEESFFNLSYCGSYFWDHPFGMRPGQSFPVNFEHYNETEQGQGNITLEITVTNVQSYSLTVEYAPNNTNPIQQPTISILSPVNDSFFNVSIEGVYYQLIYESNSSLSWVGYSIGGNGYSIEGNGSGNVTVTGNSTFVHDFGSSGNHTLTVYANDTSGSWATPQTITYLVNFYPDTAPTPSPSPTLQPTAPNTPKGSVVNIVLGLIVALVVIAVCAGLLAYIRKRRG